MAIRHSTVATGSNNGNRQVSIDAWNHDHSFTGTAGMLLGADGTEIDPNTIGSSTAVADRTTLASSINTVKSRYLTESGREGTFVHFTTAAYASFTGRTLSTDIGYDPQQGVFVQTATGAWVRPYWGIPITDRMFGATDGTDVADEIEAWATFWANVPCQKAVCSVNGTTSRAITIGLSGTDTATKCIQFNPTIKATAAMDVMITMQHLTYCTIDFAGCQLWGYNTTASSSSLSSRLAKVGIQFINCSITNFIGVIRAHHFYHWAMAMPAGGQASDYGSLPYIRANDCGSAPIVGGGNELTANWSSPTQVGVSGSVNQTMTLSVDAIPSTDPTSMQQVVKIAGYYYNVTAISGTGPYTVTIFPWLDNTSYDSGSGSGTLEWVFGGMVALRGNDSNVLRCQGGDALRCGFAFLDSGLYGQEWGPIGAASVEIYAGIGTGPNGAQVGGKNTGGYLESTVTTQVLSLSSGGTTAREFGALRGQVIDFTKWMKHGPRNTSGTLRSQSFTGFVRIAGAEGKQVVAGYGTSATATWDPSSVAAGASTTTTVTINAAFAVGTPLRATFSNSLAGCVLTAYVSAVGGNSDSCTATVVLFNPTGSSVDLASGTLTVTVLQ